MQRIAVVVIACLSCTAVLSTEPVRAPRPQDAAAGLARFQAENAVLRERLARWRYGSMMQRSFELWTQGHLDEVHRLLQACEPRYRHWEWHYLSQLLLQPERSLIGHTKKITCLTVSRDGKHIASGSADGTLRLWDAVSGRCRHILRTSEPWDAAFAPDGRIVVISTRLGGMLGWDVESGARVFDFIAGVGAYGKIGNVQFTDDGKYLVAMERGIKHDRKWKILFFPVGRLKSAKPDRTLEVPGEPLGVDSKGNRAISRPRLNFTEIVVRNVRDGSIIGRSTHAFTVLGAAFSRDGQRTFVQGRGNFDLSMSARGRKWRRSVRVDGQVAVQPDFDRLIPVRANRGILLYDVATGSLPVAAVRGHDAAVTRAALFSDDAAVVSGDQDGKILITPVRRRSYRDFSFSCSAPFLSFDRAGTMLAVTGGKSHDMVQVLNLETGRVAATIPDRMFGQFTGDSVQVATLGRRDIAVTNLKSGRSRKVAEYADRWNRAFKVSADGRLLAVDADKGVVEIRRVEDGRSVRRLNGLSSVLSLAWNSSSSRLAVGLWGDATGLSVWDTKSGTKLFSAREDHAPWGLAFNPARSEVALCGGPIVTIRDADTGKVTRRLFTGGQAARLAYTADGQRIAAIVRDSLGSSIWIWDAHTGQRLLRVDNPTGGDAIAFSPNGRWLVTQGIGGSGKVSVYEAAGFEIPHPRTK